MTEIPNLPESARWAIVGPGDMLIISVDDVAFPTPELRQAFLDTAKEALGDIRFVIIEGASSIAVHKPDPESETV